MCRRTICRSPASSALLTILTVFLTISAENIALGQHHKQRIATSRRIQSSHKSRASGSGGGLHHAHAAVPKQFIYVYDMPAEFNEDIKELPVQWHPEQYDYDQVQHSSPDQRMLPGKYYRLDRVHGWTLDATQLAQADMCCSLAGITSASPQQRGAHNGPTEGAAVFHSSVLGPALQLVLAAVEHSRQALGCAPGLPAPPHAPRVLLGQMGQSKAGKLHSNHTI